MRNKSSLLNYVAIPAIGISALVSSCDLDNFDSKPQIYRIQQMDVNKDGLKDIVIKDSKDKIKEIYLKQKEGNYLSLREINLENKIKKMRNNYPGYNSWLGNPANFDP